MKALVLQFAGHPGSRLSLMTEALCAAYKPRYLHYYLHIVISAKWEELSPFSRKHLAECQHRYARTARTVAVVDRPILRLAGKRNGDNKDVSK